MKRTILKNWMAAALLAGACCGLVACDDNDDNRTTPPAEPGVEVVVGEYVGTMQIIGVQPTEDNGEAPAGTEVAATVTENTIEFKDFPIRDLIAAVLGDAGTDEVIDGIIEAVGPVSYDLPYAASMSEDKASVKMALAPEVLNITMSDPENGDITIAVTITAASEGAYTLESKALGFNLAVEKIQIGDGEPIPVPMSLDFSLAKK